MTEKEALLLVLGICFWMLERRIERWEKQQEAAAIDYAAEVKHKQLRERN